MYAVRFKYRQIHKNAVPQNLTGKFRKKWKYCLSLLPTCKTQIVMYHILSLADVSCARSCNYSRISRNCALRNSILPQYFSSYRFFYFQLFSLFTTHFLIIIWKKKYFPITVWDGRMLLEICSGRINTIPMRT